VPKLWPCLDQLQAVSWRVRCGSGHLHRESPEKTKTEYMSSRCNCILREGKKPHPTSYRGCSRARGEEHSDLPQGDPNSVCHDVLSAYSYCIHKGRWQMILEQLRNDDEQGKIEETLRKTCCSIISSTVNLTWSHSRCHQRLRIYIGILSKCYVAVINLSEWSGNYMCRLL
jgi:hypothetical protein